MKTLNRHVRWRRDIREILICDCKRLIDLKLPLKYEKFMLKLDCGIVKPELTDTEKKVLSDFEKFDLLSDLEIRNINPDEFDAAVEIMRNAFEDPMPRKPSFLRKKLDEFPDLFMGAFLDGRMAGAIFGFPRDGYVLISELAVDRKFSGRGFGKKLVRRFEKKAFSMGDSIRVGASDRTLKFYEANSYRPVILAQFPDGAYKSDDFRNDLRLTSITGKSAEFESESADINTINRLRSAYPKASFQYVFEKLKK